jgi:predicted Fe-Mo cluster-binding NifX family protein
LIQKGRKTVEKMIILATIDANGLLTGIGRAPKVAIVTVGGHKVEKIEEIPARWDETHEHEEDGLHHSNIAKFLIDHKVKEIIAGGAGPDMRKMIGKLGINLHLQGGNYRDAVEELLRQ